MCRADAEAALELASHEPPAAIVLDLMMEGMDGLELTRRLERAPALAKTVIVALTAYAMKGDEGKPIDTRTLGATIAAYLERERR